MHRAPSESQEWRPGQRRRADGSGGQEGGGGTARCTVRDRIVRRAPEGEAAEGQIVAAER